MERARSPDTPVRQAAKTDAEWVADLERNLATLRDRMGGVLIAQAAIVAIIPTAKLNTPEWNEAKEAVRKAVVSARLSRTRTRKSSYRIAEMLRRDSFGHPGTRHRAQEVYDIARDYLNHLETGGL